MSEAPSPWRTLLPGQVSQIHLYTVSTGADQVVYETAAAVAEAPNWTLDGSALVFNEEGTIYRLDLASGQVSPIQSGDRNDFNNDHVLDPDGVHIFGTAEDGHIYRFPLAGGPAERVTRDDDGLMAHYLHGVSPDGNLLVHIGGAARADGAVYNIYSFNRATGETRQVTDSPKPHDGSEFSPDGQWLYFNSERASELPGHSQIFRAQPDGNGIEQLTFDERVNWFPHLAPDGARLVYISFPPGTLGHPANKAVYLVVADPLCRHEVARIGFFGGQGTINVNSWAPDSDRFAYVAYPVA
ncbi:MAG: hypothetical protein LBR19_09295 [Bifidobacteriaceae bacterium]|jgi:Tol biopolymer transport system component|nr:hypothetical protein [Bifidobacteriaceae bacterium]